MWYTDGPYRSVADVIIRNGFMTDGASTFFPVSLIVPQWKAGKDEWNLAPCVHDGLYMHKGFGVFTRDECDDFLRGIWREAGMTRVVAGAADIAVNLVAGGEKHWGSDEYLVKNKFHLAINGRSLI